MKIEVEYQDDIAVLKLDGELDIATVDFFIDKILEVKKEYENIIFDFSKVEFVDSTGVGSIIKLLQDNNELNYAITNLQPDVKEIFQILNLKEILGEEIFISSNQKAIDFLI
ncbi:anti-sigma factor antagonist [Sporohalobacter salinus]|uniref:anti-sigma factor antagonist n=1 Tax=Sporohalobacter salinus TaxID=1494606 RepID=UPI001960E0D0|nr:anti-anti-sigma factor [Sporohalobacter salinus]